MEMCNHVCMLRRGSHPLLMVLIFLISALATPLPIAKTVNAQESSSPILRLSNSESTSVVHIFTPQISDQRILADVVRQMEPALTNFLTKYDFTKLNSTMDKLETKYKKNRLSIDYSVSNDAKLFVVVRIGLKKYCYRGTGNNRIKLYKSTRCS